MLPVVAILFCFDVPYGQAIAHNAGMKVTVLCIRSTSLSAGQSMKNVDLNVKMLKSDEGGSKGLCPSTDLLSPMDRVCLFRGPGSCP